MLQLRYYLSWMWSLAVEMDEEDTFPADPKRVPTVEDCDRYFSALMSGPNDIPKPEGQLAPLHLTLFADLCFGVSDEAPS